MHVLRFEGDSDRLAIILIGREQPIGYIRPLNGQWFGEMTLDGYKVGYTANDANEIAGEFQAWVASGLPPSPKLRWDHSKAAESIEL
jgi:hypothetical protein